MTPTEQKEKWDAQVLMAERIVNELDINIVTCGDCGHVLLHSMDNCDEIECPHCGFQSEACDFPDLFHERFLEDFKNLYTCNPITT